MTSAQDVAARWVAYWMGNASRLIGTGWSGNVHPSPDGRDVYSYGSHFSMVHVIEHPDQDNDRRWPRLWLLNGDSYSPTTTRHQSAVRDAIRNHGSAIDQIIVPFTALSAAGIDYDSIQPVEVQDERFEMLHHSSDSLDDVPEHLRREYIANIGEYRDRDRGDDGLFHWTTQRHWLGASLFTADYRAETVIGHCDGENCEHGYVYTRGHDIIEHETRTAYFLSAFDENETRPLYFLCELPEPATSVKDALEVLKPEPVKKAIDFTRQGDIFAIPTALTTRELRKMGARFGKRNGLPALPDDVGLHEGRDGELFANGCIYKPDENGSLTLNQDFGPWTAGTRFAWVEDDPEVMKARDEHRERDRELTRLAVLMETNHVATETAVLDDGSVYARGCLYHQPDGWRDPDHKRRKMGDGRTWHEIHRNTVPRSFSAPRAWTIRGSVD